MSSHDSRHAQPTPDTTVHGSDPLRSAATGFGGGEELGPLSSGNHSQADLLRSLNLYPIGGGAGSVFDETPVMMKPPPHSSGEGAEKREEPRRWKSILEGGIAQEQFAKMASDFLRDPKTGAWVTFTCNATKGTEWNFGPQGFYGYSPVDPTTGQRYVRWAASMGPGGRKGMFPVGGYVGLVTSNDPTESWHNESVNLSLGPIQIAYYPNLAMSGAAIRVWIPNIIGFYAGEDNARMEANLPIMRLTQMLHRVPVLQQQGVVGKCGTSVAVRNPGIGKVIDAVRAAVRTISENVGGAFGRRVPEPLKLVIQGFLGEVMKAAPEPSDTRHDEKSSAEPK